MIPILTKDQAYQLDKSTVESGLLTEEELMDNAGFSIACYILENIPNPFNQKILVVAGKGNNGGDGIIAHHYLSIWGCNSKLVLIDKKIKSSLIIKKYNISQDSISIYCSEMDLSGFEIIIDGILGIGISRKLDKRLTEIIQKVNNIPVIPIRL